MKLSTTSLLDRRSIKGLLLDLAIIFLILVTAARKLVTGDFGFSLIAPECDNDVDVLSGDITNNNNATVMTTITSSPARRQLRRSNPSSSSVMNLPEYNGIKIKDLVEVYDPTILKSTAFFARVVSIKKFSSQYDDDEDNNGEDVDDDSSTTVKFDIIAGPAQNEMYYDIDSANIRSADNEPYEFNTRAICDFGSSLRKTKGLFPCTVLTRSESSGVPTYWVLGTHGQEERHTELPLPRVRRLVVDPRAAGEEELRSEEGVLNFPDPTSNVHVDDASNTNILRGMVEVYGDGKTAQPGIITGYRHSESVYSVQMTVIHQHVARIDPQLVHPYRIYEDGTTGICNVAEDFPKLILLPCTVHSHSVTDDDRRLLSYHVTYARDDRDMVSQASGEKEMVRATLPFSRVWRHI